MRVSARAFVWPFTAPMSAARHSAVLAAEGSGAGPVKVFTICSVHWSIGGMPSIGSVGGMISAIRGVSFGAAPIWKSAPSGPAISSATNCLSVLPVTRRSTSPMRWPWVSAW
jgi:hypothetical protein